MKLMLDLLLLKYFLPLNYYKSSIILRIIKYSRIKYLSIDSYFIGFSLKILLMLEKNFELLFGKEKTHALQWYLSFRIMKNVKLEKKNSSHI